MTEHAPIHVGLSKSRPDTLNEIGTRFRLELVTFYDLIKSVRRDDKRVIDEWFNANFKRMSADEINQFNALMHEFGEAFKMAIDHAKSASEQKEPFKEISISSGDRGLDKMLSDLTFKLAHLVLMNREELSGRAFLITAVSSFEILFGHVVRAIYERNPSALSKSEYAFTLEELSQYSSIDDARAALVTRKVDALLMESVDSWSKWLSRTVNFDFPDILAEWPSAREVFARRNILVHADGRVSARYIQDVQSASLDTSKLELGKKLDLPPVYVQESLARLISLGVMLTYNTWVKLYKTDKDNAAAWLASNQDDLVEREIWLAAHLISMSAKLPQVPREIGLRLQVNGWLARKRLYGVESIADEVRAWDISALSTYYAMAKSLLLDDEQGDSEVSRVVAEGRLSWYEVATNPLYAEYRSRNPAAAIPPPGVLETDAPAE